MKIYIVPNLTKPNSNTTLESTLEFLKENSVEVSVAKDGVIDNEKIKECDFLFAIGGDGTIIDACKKASLYKKAVLGINSGRIGFLAGLESEHLDGLKKLIDGEFKTESASMLEVFVKSAPEKIYYCLNDLVLKRQSHNKMIDVNLKYNDNLLDYRGDGLIVATPVGSTAYSMSAGGPIVDRSLNAIVVTPICPFTYFSRSLVIADDLTLEIGVKGVEKNGVSVIVDGEFVDEFSATDTLCVKKSDLVTQFISLENNSFFSKLIEKIK